MSKIFQALIGRLSNGTIDIESFEVIWRQTGQLKTSVFDVAPDDRGTAMASSSPRYTDFKVKTLHPESQRMVSVYKMKNAEMNYSSLTRLTRTLAVC